jgi:hypothetical protein
MARCDRGYAARDGKIAQELSHEAIQGAALSDKYDSAMMEGIY